MTHYYTKATESLPPRRDLRAERARLGAPPVIYGHFNRLRGFGITQYYPQVGQFLAHERIGTDPGLLRALDGDVRTSGPLWVPRGGLQELGGLVVAFAPAAAGHARDE